MVLMAVGRQPNTKHLGLQNQNVLLAPDGKILGDKIEIEKTNIKNIYSVGDVN